MLVCELPIPQLWVINWASEDKLASPRIKFQFSTRNVWLGLTGWTPSLQTYDKDAWGHTQQMRLISRNKYWPTLLDLHNYLEFLKGFSLMWNALIWNWILMEVRSLLATGFQSFDGGNMLLKCLKRKMSNFKTPNFTITPFKIMVDHLFIFDRVQRFSILPKAEPPVIKHF